MIYFPLVDKNSKKRKEGICFKDLNTKSRVKALESRIRFYFIVIVLIFIGVFKIAEAVFKPLAISIVLGFLVYPVYTF